ncbi:MAG: IS1634 family transposase [Candidatus Methanoperedens sp.]|nr:IS1634 family transposase [Candidatus Methanoperedens sp.]
MGYVSKNIDHLGIVAAVCKEIGLVEEVDKIVGVGDKQIVTTGEAVMAMVINGLGFVNRPLYLTPEFMKNKPLELFFRDDLKPEDFNDDTLDRALDRLYEHNPTSIFMHIALKTAKKFGIERKFLHLDTTSMSVQGEYKFEEEDMVPIQITNGHAKNKRFDLNQFVISLISSSHADFPLWMSVLSGNSSDKKHFREVIQQFSKELSDSDTLTYFVMDSAMYTDPNIKAMSPLVKWISRVPETINEAKTLIEGISVEDMIKSDIEGYSFKDFSSSYGGFDQKWLVVFSEKGYDREIKTLNKNIDKEMDKIKTELWHLGNEEFNCPEDGLSEINKKGEKLKYYKIIKTDIEEINKTGKRGRPKKNAYLFSWKEIPGNESELLKDFLKSNYDVDWVKTAKIAKTDDDKTIIINAGEKYISLNLSNENTELDIKIDNGKTDKFIVKTENDKLNIYKTVIEVKKVYKVKANFDKDEKKIECEKNKKGKFIIASNDVNLDSNEALKEYKGQQSVERGFRFLKDPLFFASSIFLKKPERIVSLGMIMVLSLLVYSVAQFKLRKALEEKKESIPDQLGKQTTKPTMRRVFQMFDGISLLILLENEVEKIVGVLNLTEIQKKILSLMGGDYEKMYLC